MIYTDFSNYESVISLARMELPGCPDEIISSEASVVFAEFCENTQAYKEELEISLVAGERVYELVSPHDQTLIVGLAEIVLDGHPLKPGDYFMDGPARLNLDDEPGALSTCTAVAILRPTYGSDTAPTPILERWADAINMGVKARLMIKPGMEYSNPQLGAYYQQRYNAMELKAQTDVKNEFSVTREGRNGFTRSVWDV